MRHSRLIVLSCLKINLKNLSTVSLLNAKEPSVFDKAPLLLTASCLSNVPATKENLTLFSLVQAADSESDPAANPPLSKTQQRNSLVDLERKQRSLNLLLKTRAKIKAFSAYFRATTRADKLIELNKLKAEYPAECEF